ncbi:hypothetical protein E2C01_049636 [Portunus trituberculatus]|uniref:Uncharacterized protein n=1 Tax=Portunus trituberculatus TaxID=210409 RepID=A0A5B7GA01_PORTR|nr:hypothetical protein [Portunus trituberculatus]
MEMSAVTTLNPKPTTTKCSPPSLLPSLPLTISSSPRPQPPPPGFITPAGDGREDCTARTGSLMKRGGAMDELRLTIAANKGKEESSAKSISHKRGHNAVRT